MDSYLDKWMKNDYHLASLSRLVQNACNVSNFCQLVREPTRVMNNSVTNSTDISCLDHVYCNAKFKCSVPLVIPFGASDHDMVSYVRFSKDPPVPARTIRRRSYKHFIEEDFLYDMSLVNWSKVYACVDVDQAVNPFNKKFQQVLYVHARWITVQQRKHFTPWITKELKEMIKGRDMLMT